MALFKRQKGASDIPPELQPYYDGTTSKGSDKGWLRWLVRGLIAVVILILLALAGTWIWHKVSGDKDTKSTDSSISDSNSDGQTSSTSTTEPSSGTTSPSSGNPSTGSSSTDGSAPATAPSPTSTTTPPTTAAVQSATELANTGPKETVTIFLATLIIAIAAYQLRLRTRSN